MSSQIAGIKRSPRASFTEMRHVLRCIRCQARGFHGRGRCTPHQRTEWRGCGEAGASKSHEAGTDLALSGDQSVQPLCFAQGETSGLLPGLLLGGWRISSVKRCDVLTRARCIKQIDNYVVRESSRDSSKGFLKYGIRRDTAEQARSFGVGTGAELLQAIHGRADA